MVVVIEEFDGLLGDLMEGLVGVLIGELGG